MGFVLCQSLQLIDGVIIDLQFRLQKKYASRRLNQSLDLRRSRGKLLGLTSLSRFETPTQGQVSDAWTLFPRDDIQCATRCHRDRAFVQPDEYSPAGLDSLV